jgi:hypothetical protein
VFDPFASLDELTETANELFTGVTSALNFVDQSILLLTTLKAATLTHCEPVWPTIWKVPETLPLLTGLEIMTAFEGSVVVGDVGVTVAPAVIVSVWLTESSERRLAEIFAELADAPLKEKFADELEPFKIGFELLTVQAASA